MDIIQIENAKTKFFLSKEQYLEFKKAWAKLAKEKKITTEHVVLYNLLRGKLSNNGFTPITNPNKIANGARVDAAYQEALYVVRRNVSCLTTGIGASWVKKEAGEFVGTLSGTITLGTLALLKEY